MAKKGERIKRKTEGLLKARIYRLREENRRCCGDKIKKYLKDEYGISLGVTAIYKILREKYKLRSKWKKNQKRGHVPKAAMPREVVQMDTVDFGEVFAFTGVDIFAKDVAVKLYPALTSTNGADFLDHAFERFKYTALLQADGGPEFKGEFKQNVPIYADRFRVARPYKKNEQSFIESFNRTLRKECLGWGKYKPHDIQLMKKDLVSYLEYYHAKRAHLSLNLKTPNAILEECQASDFLTVHIVWRLKSRKLRPNTFGCCPMNWPTRHRSGRANQGLTHRHNVLEAASSRDSVRTTVLGSNRRGC